MNRTKSAYPLDRLGVYKRLEDVPAKHRFERYEREYSDRNVWQEFCEYHEYQQGTSSNFRRDVDRVGSNWIDHMDAIGRHHALATPDHVETWCEQLVAAKSDSTAYNYWVRIKRFYEWLQRHVAHPHVYNPVLMAAVNGGAAGRIWDIKLAKWRKARSRGGQDE